MHMTPIEFHYVMTGGKTIIRNFFFIRFHRNIELRLLRHYKCCKTFVYL